MDIDSSDQSDVEYAGKSSGQTFKQFQQEQLIKAKVMPASKLVETAKRNAERLRAFEAAVEEERRHKRTARPVPSNKLDNLPLTREPFEE